MYCPVFLNVICWIINASLTKKFRIISYNTFCCRTFNSGDPAIIAQNNWLNCLVIRKRLKFRCDSQSLPSLGHITGEDLSFLLIRWHSFGIFEPIKAHRVK